METARLVDVGPNRRAVGWPCITCDTVVESGVLAVLPDGGCICSECLRRNEVSPLAVTAALPTWAQWRQAQDAADAEVLRALIEVPADDVPEVAGCPW
jgi:hypothetical protein